MTEPDGTPHPLAREAGGFLTAVFVGSLGGLLAGQLLTRWADPATAGNLALALGTTLTAATHARLVHGLHGRALLPRVLLAAPLAYAVMHVVHGVLGR
jgi:hypothetical protein